ncbi:hypothetical protein JYQ62_23130 [Nostoc sp. UHCC 0702]|nr:hypothetical protein JYQ62_23130 [Nostoc sp. UHCC 0702]
MTAIAENMCASCVSPELIRGFLLDRNVSLKVAIAERLISCPPDYF